MEYCVGMCASQGFPLRGAGGEETVLLARACGVPVGRRSGGRLATTLVATKNIIIFFSPFSLSRPFLIEGVLGSQNLFSER